MNGRQPAFAQQSRSHLACDLASPKPPDGIFAPYRSEIRVHFGRSEPIGRLGPRIGCDASGRHLWPLLLLSPLAVIASAAANKRRRPARFRTVGSTRGSTDPFSTDSVRYSPNLR